MIGIIVYLISCFAASLVLTFIYVMMRPVHSRDELKSWRALLLFFILALGGPYIYDEALTRLVGGDLSKLSNKVIDDAGVDADLAYYRVISYNGKSARVVIVCREQKSSWGGSDRPVLATTLAKDGNGWKVDSYRIINSFDKLEDGFTFPPYF